MIRTFLSALGLAAVVQGATQSVTVCSAGQCLTGNSNITRLGAVLSASSSGSFILLPGQYTSSVQPATLEQSLSSATSTIVFTTGFGNSTSPTTPSLPLNIALQPGLLNYPNDLYSGDPTFISLPQNVNATFNATAINRGSIILAANTVAAIQAVNNGAKNRVVLWDTVPYISQLPYDMAGNLEVVSLQNSLCSPACSNSGICSTSGTCICKANFSGDSCEQCADGHFGPDCTPCPTGCTNCDSGITGTGTCLSVQLPSNAPENCNCNRGTCGTGGTCTCAPGWATSTTGTNSTQCNTCQPGFFLDSNGNCSACGARCQACSANTGTCTQCDSNNLTPGAGGNPLQCSQTTTCATNEFLSGTTCTRCNGACASCFGPNATDCLLCAGNNVLLNGACVAVSLTSGAAGICTGTTLVANRAKGVCDVCPLGCANCAYDAFDQQSTQYSSVKCTKCQVDKFLSGGNCVDTCPDGTFAASDGTCTACSSSCATCIGSATTCLTCKNNQLASAGTCVSTCPTNSFSSAGKCTSCHPDCATCSGPSFNQCLTCPDSNPVLTSAKRCVTTCSKNEYFDEGSGSCKSCDSSCGSCSSGGSNSCLSCASSSQVLRAGQCVSVNCGNGAGPTSGLGVCLAELVQVPGNSGSPPTSIPPINPNSQQPSSGGGHKLTWWQILLIVLGVLLLLAIILILWRRRQRKKRAQETEQFKQNMKHQGLWSKFFRNPFSAWWARRRAAAINRRSRSDLERRTDKDWRNTQSEPYTPGTYNNHSPGLSSGERRPAVGVPKSIGHTSWITMGQHDVRSLMSGPNHAGLGAIRERDEGDRYTTRSGRSAKESYRSRRDDMRYGDEYRRGESQFWGQEIEQDDSRSERTRTDQTYLRSGVTGDPYQFDRPSSRNSDNQTDLVSIIKSEGVSERWDDRDRRHYERSRSGYERSERSRPYDERSYRTRDRDYPRQDYPASVSTQSQSRSYDRDRDRRGFGSSSGSHSHGPETPSMYSQPTLPRIPPHAAAFDEPPRDAVLSSRFSMSTTAASTRPPPKRKQVPQEPMPLDQPPRKLTDAEMYKMSKLFPDLLGLMSPTKKSPPTSTAIKSPSRNPFRI